MKRNVLLLLLFLACAGLVRLSAAPGPNVLFICVDDLKPALGSYGDRTVRTPHIDRLAARGLVLEQAYCNQAVCAPSRNALMTGVRPTRMGIYDLGTNFRVASSNAVTLSQYFMKHGYRAEALGKIFHVGHGNHEDPVSWSVPHWKANSIAYVLPESRANQGLTREEALFANQLSDIARLPRGAPYEAADVADDAYPDGKIAAETIRRLRSAKARPEEPFLLAVGFLKPHLPFCAPKRYWDLYDRAAFTLPALRAAPQGAPRYAPSHWGELRQYSGMPTNGPVTDDQARALLHGYHAAVSYMDAQLGKVLDELDRLDLAKNTIIVLWGDHGWHLGDHGWWSKHSNYEQATRIPLVVVAPGVSKPGSRATNALVETVDIFPTLAELAGLPAPKVPQGLDGTSFVGVLRDPAKAGKDRAFHAFPRGERIGRAVRTPRHRLVEWKIPGAAAETAAIELYDYQEDPHETRNLAAEQPEVARRLIGMLAELPEAKPQISKPRNAARQRFDPAVPLAKKETLTLARTNHWLIIRGPHLPGEIRINYLEAYCRPGSTDADWMKHTVIAHTNQVVSLSADGKTLRLRDTIADGVTVEHTIVARDDEVDFRLVAHNGGSGRSEAHWAQPCVRLSAFMGFDEKSAGNATDYLSRCFIFLDGRLARMPTRDWATNARYVPGQTWCPAHVPRTDVNPRPLSPLVPSNGLIGGFSADEKWVFATAWEPYQELFQGVARCLHSDFRLGGLAPGERREIRGKIYLVPGDVEALLARYEKDFPEHRPARK